MGKDTQNKKSYICIELNTEKVYYKCKEVNGMNELYKVYTSKEAADKWGLSANTVTQWYNRGKFTDQEARKSAGTILVTHEAMERVSGKNIE